MSDITVRMTFPGSMATKLRAVLRAWQEDYQGAELSVEQLLASLVEAEYRRIREREGDG